MVRKELTSIDYVHRALYTEHQLVLIHRHESREGANLSKTEQGEKGVANKRII